MGRGDFVPRIITNFDVRLRYEREGAFYRANPVNLSETGCCIRLEHAVQKDQEVELQVRLQGDVDDYSLHLPARIVWVRHDTVNDLYYAGLGFQNIAEEQVRAIRAYVENGASGLLAFLSDFPIFADFSREDCEILLRITTLRELERGEILYQDGSNDPDLRGLYIVQAGLLSIYKGPEPRSERKLAVVSPGQIFGEVSLVTEQPHTATVRAVNDSTLIQINALGFKLLRNESPRLALKIMEVVARALVSRLGRTTRKLFSPVKT